MSTPEPRTTAPEDRVPSTQLIAYGMGGVVPIALFNIAGHLMGLLGNISLGLSAFWLGTIMIIPRLWDAFSDPIVGHLSDNTRTRWGRRRPYILIGGIAVALSFVAMWWIPRGEWVRSLFPGEVGYNAFQLAYILLGLLIFFTAITVFEIPHGALGIELSGDYHERTRLFSAKSFFGNVFAMGTPWLLWLATREFFSGPGGNEADGMRYVSIFIAAGLIPLSFWWFFTLREPGFAIAKQQRKSDFWTDIGTTISNSTFLSLVAIIFTLAMGFDFVALFNYYITIFYLYGGDTEAASALLGINGTIWAVTGLAAVFPLNWLSRRLGKNRTLLVAIFLMCAAQLSKLLAYNPELPYLVIIPTVLLSSGMLMFFTLGSSMLGDICDEDELVTGTRNEGSYCSVYWWFIATGKAFASFVTGALLWFTAFDEQQKVLVDAVSGNVAAIKADAEKLLKDDGNRDAARANINENMTRLVENSKKLSGHLAERHKELPDHSDHIGGLIEGADAIRAEGVELQNRSASLVAAPENLVREADALLDKTTLVRKQTPSTLYRLRFFEIGVPLALSVVSIFLTLRYPLTEARCYEIKQVLEARRAKQASPSPN